MLLQKEDELEHLVKTVSEERIQRVEKSDKVSPTPPSERKDFRERSMTQYMEDAQTVDFDLNNYSTERVYYRTGKPLDVPGVLHAERLSAWEGSLAVVEDGLPDKTRKQLQEHGQVRVVKAGVERGILVGLTTEDDVCLGLGVVDHIDYENESIHIHTPLTEINEAYRIQFGSLRYHPDGHEAGFVEPGTL